MHTARDKAFTLIELLLVIAIISILAAVGVSIYRQSFATNRVDAVSIEMQHVLEAAMAFYVDNNAWPTAVAQPPCDPDTGSTFVANYLPNANSTSPFGNNFCWSQAGGTTNRLFWVAVVVPGIDSVALAMRIAGHLPNAVATSDPTQPNPPPTCSSGSPCYVRAEITVPGTSTNTLSGLTIVATGDCKTGQNIPNTGGGSCVNSGTAAGYPLYQISFATCPSAEQPVLTIVPNFENFPGLTLSTGYTPLDSSAYAVGPCSNSPNGNNQEICNAEAQTDLCQGSPCQLYPVAQAGASYTIICEPTTSAKGSV